eukprot:213031-Rhodomonas_salina.1
MHAPDNDKEDDETQGMNLPDTVIVQEILRAIKPFKERIVHDSLMRLLQTNDAYKTKKHMTPIFFLPQEVDVSLLPVQAIFIHLLLQSDIVSAETVNALANGQRQSKNPSATYLARSKSKSFPKQQIAVYYTPPSSANTPIQKRLYSALASAMQSSTPQGIVAISGDFFTSEEVYNAILREFDTIPAAP